MGTYSFPAKLFKLLNKEIQDRNSAQEFRICVWPEWPKLYLWKESCARQIRFHSRKIKGIPQFENPKMVWDSCLGRVSPQRKWFTALIKCSWNFFNEENTLELFRTLLKHFNIENCPQASSRARWHSLQLCGPRAVLLDTAHCLEARPAITTKYWASGLTSLSRCLWHSSSSTHSQLFLTTTP